jgi:hypothetical protein
MERLVEGCAEFLVVVAADFENRYAAFVGSEVVVLNEANFEIPALEDERIGKKSIGRVGDEG